MSDKGRDNSANDVLNPKVANLIRKVERLLGVNKLFSKKNSTGEVTQLGILRYKIMRLNDFFNNGDIFFDGRKIVIRNNSSPINSQNIDLINRGLLKLPSHIARKLINDSRTILTFHEEVRKGYRIVPSDPSY
ncbi:hypothetical protein J7L67_10095 [bacterium]|nr:hypothetical protein [bacterium]